MDTASQIVGFGVIVLVAQLLVAACFASQRSRVDREKRDLHSRRKVQHALSGVLLVGVSLVKGAHAGQSAAIPALNRTVP